MHQRDGVEELLPLLLEGQHLAHGGAGRLLRKDGVDLEAEPSVRMQLGPGVLSVAACSGCHCRLLLATRMRFVVSRDEQRGIERELFLARQSEASVF